MSECPGYRLRLFLSVDLVGSTAFKGGRGSALQTESEPFPIWVLEIRRFYREFPEAFTRHFQEEIANHAWQPSDGQVPLLWKTIGDEILFCTRVNSIDHLAHCITAFIRALHTFGRILDESQPGLDVKGAGWLAAFPAPNFTIGVSGKFSSASVEASEQIETAADGRPSDFDFLGKEIDCGFRVSKNAAGDKFIASCELALALCEAANTGVFGGKFSYRGREILRGVLQSKPYPIVAVDAERSAGRREIREREWALTGEKEANSVLLRDFLLSFMTDEEMELPLLSSRGASIPAGHETLSYRNFKRAWQSNVEETDKRERGEAESDAANPEGGSLPDSVEEALDRTISRLAVAHMDEPALKESDGPPFA